MNEGEVSKKKNIWDALVAVAITIVVTIFIHSLYSCHKNRIDKECFSRTQNESCLK